MKRDLPKTFRIARCGISAKMQPIPNDDYPHDTQQRFMVKTKIAVHTENVVSSSDAKKLESLAGQEIILETKGYKMSKKKIYSVRTSRYKANNQQAGSSFLLTVVADGGLAIKQFVGGEQYSSTSVSQLLGTKCHCTTFDILAVTFLSDSGNQTFA